MDLKCESRLKICLIQLRVKETLKETLSSLTQLIEKSVITHKPRVIALPEAFNFAYDAKQEVFNNAAELVPDGESCRYLSSIAKKYDVYIVGGSIIERENEKLFNTSTIWNANGELIAKHRKVHLCDVHIENGSDCDEASILSAGNDITTFHIDDIKCGVAICYDADFDEFIKIYRKVDCHLMFFPSAFDTLSAREWDLIHCARAYDNQFFVASISGARVEPANYVLLGRSMIIDPAGRILTQADEKEGIIFYEIDLDDVKKRRMELPLFTARRTDVFEKYKSLI